VWRCAALLLLGCGRLDFESQPRADGGVTVDSPADGAAFCQATPCKLTLDQCGCPGGQACQRTGATTDERGCIAEGTAAPDEPCSLDAECVAGYACINFLGGSGRCQRYCAGDADCGPGLECAQLVEGVGIGLCGSTCTLTGGCPGTDACKVLLANDFDTVGAAAVPACVPPAGATAGTTCNSTIECAAGLFCDLTPHVCSPMCAFDGSLNCASGACTRVEAPIFLAGIEYGVCR
jgi:hypothetical protein